MIAMNNLTNLGHYFCLCYFNPDCEYIGYEEVMEESQSVLTLDGQLFCPL